MEPEVDLIEVGQSPDGVPWPDPEGPKPDTISDTEWQVITMRHAGLKIDEIASHLQVTPRTVQNHISRLRSRFGSEYLKNPGSRLVRTPSVATIIAQKAGGIASSKKWADLREALAGPTGIVSAKAVALAEMVLDRYLEESPQGEALRETLTIADAKQLAALSVALGERADVMSTPTGAPGAFTPGGPGLFGAIDGAAQGAASGERAHQLELIVARFHESGLGPGKTAEAIEATGS